MAPLECRTLTCRCGLVCFSSAGPLYAKGTKLPPGVADSEGSKYVPGTTWVFDDDEDDKKEGGSGGGGGAMSIDDFASQFDMVTGGEEFRSE